MPGYRVLTPVRKPSEWYACLARLVFTSVSSRQVAASKMSKGAEQYLVIPCVPIDIGCIVTGTSSSHQQMPIASEPSAFRVSHKIFCWLQPIKHCVSFCCPLRLQLVAVPLPEASSQSLTSGRKLEHVHLLLMPQVCAS